MLVANKYQIFDNMIEGVQVIDRNFRYFYVNKTVAEQGKSTIENLLGHSMMEKYPGIEKTILFKTIQKCMFAKGDHQILNEFDFPDGSNGYFELRFHPVEEGVLILSFDVTKQKRAELIVKNTNAMLEEQVRLRIKEISDQKLLIEKQLQKLKNLNDIKDKFFSIVAHDLKSPMNSLKMYSNLIIHHIEKLDINEIKIVGEDLLKSVDNAISLTDNLITWAKLQMQQYSTQSEKIPVKDIVSNVLNVYDDIARQKEINVEYDIEKDVSLVGDKNQIEFIVRNVVNNAIKFTPRGGTIRLKANTTSRNEVQISISDNGVGIPEVLKSILFKVPKKQSTMGTEGEKGTGLGLTLCYEFMQLNEGNIEVESEEGKGTTINLLLKKFREKTYDMAN